MLKASLIGHLGRDCETRTSPDGSTFTTFAVACNGTKKDAPPTWVDVSISGQRGERLAPYLKKGIKVLIHGNLALRNWNGRDGTPKTGLTCNTDYLEFLSSPNEARQETAPPAAPAGSPPTRTSAPRPEPAGHFADDDSVPF